MDPSFWISRWSEHRIGFHEGAPNQFLVRHAGRISGTRVLVPLCGKTEDLAYLASLGHEVIGIELVEDAVRAFFAEHGASPEIARRGELAIYTAGAITVIAGDLFAVTREDIGTIDAIYDRAALIALPPDMRPRYLAQLRALTAPRMPTLLITIEYPQDRASGPPFAVLETEVHTLYAETVLLEEQADTHSRIAEQGLAPVQRCYATRL